jgi:hypothetical protein
VCGQKGWGDAPPFWPTYPFAFCTSTKVLAY